MTSAHATPDGCLLSINGHEIAPSSQIPGGELFSPSASKSNYILIQFIQLPDPNQEAELRGLKLQFCRLIHPNSWLARFEPSDLTPLRQLPFVVYANPYHESLSLDPDFETKLSHQRRPQGLVGTRGLGSGGPSSTPPERHDVFINLHPRSRQPEELRNHLVTNYGISRDRLSLERSSLNASLTADEILQVAKIDDVASVQKQPIYTPLVHLNGLVVRALDAQKIATKALSRIDDDFLFNLDGSGEIICFADSGFDQGRTVATTTEWVLGIDPVHPFFKQRVLKLDPRSDEVGKAKGTNAEISRAGKCDDLINHGTHVAGIALGSYTKMQAQPAMKLRDNIMTGIAPKAEMVMQNIFGFPTWTADGRLETLGRIQLASLDYPKERIFLDPYYGHPNEFFPKAWGKLTPKDAKEKWRVYIHNNSWGAVPNNSGAAIGYAAGGEMVDETVFHAPDLCVIFGSGNDGDNQQVTIDFPATVARPPDLPMGQINGYATAKNVITVGACYNTQWIRNENLPENKPDQRLYSSFWPESKHGSLDIEPCHIPRFSSRGPCIDRNHPNGRHRYIIKPDVVAPGVAIYSAKSRSMDPSVPPSGGIAPKDDPLWSFDSGTSMAAPVVSGAIALLRQALKVRGFTQPSAALIKALIVNGAVDLSQPGIRGTIQPGNPDTLGGCGVLGSELLTEAPSNAQGFGRLDIHDSIENIVDRKLSGFDDAGPPKPPTNRDWRLIAGKTPASNMRYLVDIPPPPNFATNPTRARAHLKATVAYTDYPGEGIQNQLALSIQFQDDVIGAMKNTSVEDPGDTLKEQMLNNNVQKLVVQDINQFVNDKTPMRAWVVVTEKRILDDPFRFVDDSDPDAKAKAKSPLAFAVCWKVWYTE